MDTERSDRIKDIIQREEAQGRIVNGECYGPPNSREKIAAYLAHSGGKGLAESMGADMDRMVTACAKAAHEINRVWCEINGDSSQKIWEDSPAWQRESAIKGVAGVLSGNSPEQQHEAWCVDKAATGWRYGTVKDPDAKTHPCMVPYSALPEVQRAKDALFVSTVKAMSAAMAFSVPPL